ncbi:MAG: 5'/3'-nucleotidase SurE [Acidimicrobiales bacterium]|nr:5'/3'-nucleotidase SurE [Acidimicrobiales bacterium]
MRIMLTNDDGINSEGLHVLARSMQQHGDVFIAAPDSEYSGAGAAIGPIHLSEPEVRSTKIDEISTAWTVSGPPALCVMLARLGAFGDVDLVVSGINPGANVGRSVYHSGTVGAALTARHANIPSLAVSQHVSGFGGEGQSWDDLIQSQKWDVAAQVASSVVEGLLQDEIGDSPVVNVNVPNLDLSDIRGWRFTNLGAEPPREIEKIELLPLKEEEGSFRVSMTWGGENHQPPDVDTGAVMNNEISVSYLSRIVALTPPKSSGIGMALKGLLETT